MNDNASDETVIDPASAPSTAAASEPASFTPPELRVLAGRQQGARIGLMSGPTLLGSALHCAIVLRDAGVEPEHLLFSCADEGLTIRVLGAPVRIDGEPVAGGQIRYHPGMTIEVGSVTVGLGPSDHDWSAPHVGAAAASAATGNSADSSDSADSTGAADAGGATDGRRDAEARAGVDPASIVTNGLGVGDPAAPNAEADPAAAPAGSDDGRRLGASAVAARRWLEKQWGGPRRGRVILAGLVVVGLFAALAAATAGSFGHREPTRAEREQQARDRVTDLGLAEVGVETQADGRIGLVGYVPDPSALQRLRQVAVDSGYALKVYPVSELQRFAGEWLGSRQLKAEIRYLGAGTLEVIGQDPPDRKLSAAVARLTREVPGVASVVATIAPPVIAAAPSPPPADPDPYVLGGVNGVNPGHPVPYISSGQSYIFSGGALKNGMTVMAIEPERVVVDDHGRRLASEIQVR